MNTVSKKKTMLACLLAAALGASTCAGGLLLKADAASPNVMKYYETIKMKDKGAR